MSRVRRSAGARSEAGHDLAEDVLDEMAEVFLPLLAGLRSPHAGSQTWGSAPIAL